MQYLLRAETREEANEWAVDLAIHTGRESALDRNNRIPGHAGPVAEQALADPEADPTFIKKVAGELYVECVASYVMHRWCCVPCVPTQLTHRWPSIAVAAR